MKEDQGPETTVVKLPSLIWLRSTRDDLEEYELEPQHFVWAPGSDSEGGYGPYVDLPGVLTVLERAQMMGVDTEMAMDLIKGYALSLVEGVDVSDEN